MCRPDLGRGNFASALLSQLAIAPPAAADTDAAFEWITRDGREIFEYITLQRAAGSGP